MTTITDWLEITITFNAKCNACAEEVLPGKALWSASAKAARHLSCGERSDNQINKTPKQMSLDIVETAVEFVKRNPVIELKCFVCGKKTGCNECEFLARCKQRTVSKYCICDECSKREESFDGYKQSFAAKAMKYLK